MKSVHFASILEDCLFLFLKNVSIYHVFVLPLLNPTRDHTEDIRDPFDTGTTVSDAPVVAPQSPGLCIDLLMASVVD